MRNAVRLFGLAIVVSQAPSMACQADSSLSAPLDLGTVVREVREHNPAIRAAENDALQAAAMARSVRAWPDPQLGVEYWDLPRPGLNLGAAGQRLIDVEQDIPFPVKTWIASDVAMHERHRREAGVERVAQEQVLMAKEAYWDLYAATYSATALDAVGRALGELTRLSDQRNRLGQVGRMEQLMDPMAKMEQLDLENALLDLAQERLAAQARLNTLMGADPGRALPDPPESPAMAEAPDEQTVLQRAVGGRAELQEARHHLLHMQAQRRLARAGWFPDLMVQYSAVETPGGPPTAMAMAKVSLPFVWFWRQGADVDAAARMADQARVEAEGMERETRAMVRTEVGALDTARRQRDRILRETLPLADQALHLGVSGYRSGTVGVADALSAVKAYQAARLMAVGITAQCGRSRAALDQLTGDRPESDFDKEHLHHDE